MRVYRNNTPVFEKKYGKNGKYVIKPHYHDEVTLGIILNGETNVTINKKKYYLNSGSVILIPRDIVHICNPVDEDNFEYLVLHIENSFIKRSFNINPQNIEPQIALLDIDFLNKFIEREIYTDELESILSEFNFGQHMDSSPYLVSIKNYIDSNYLDKITLDSISDKFGINKYSLIRGFKRKYNISPHLYLINKRVNKAKELITKEYSIADASAYCGFYDQSHFVKTFKDYTGITPDLYR